jgi:hypothetical protein
MLVTVIRIKTDKYSKVLLSKLREPRECRLEMLFRATMSHHRHTMAQAATRRRPRQKGFAALAHMKSSGKRAPRPDVRQEFETHFPNSGITIETLTQDCPQDFCGATERLNIVKILHKSRRRRRTPRKKERYWNFSSL